MKKNPDNLLAPFYGSSPGKISKPEAEELSRAIEEFKSAPPDVPVERLYTAYRHLKEIIDSYGTEFSSQSNYFNDMFLRILEGRGETSNGIYRSVLRDSSEFTILNSMIGVKRHPEKELPAAGEPESEEPAEEELPVKLTLKQVLAAKEVPLDSCPEGEWAELVDEYFIEVTGERDFVRNCRKIISALLKRGDYEDYHLLAVTGYAMKRINSYDEVETKTKEYAMELLNLLSGKGEAWNRLHREYREIIRK